MKPLIDIEEINPRFLMWLGLVLLLAVVALYPLFITEPKTVNVNVTVPISQIIYRDVLVTPTPDGIIYFSNEYQSGVRKILHPFSWIRHNATGLQTIQGQDMKVSAVVYNYLTFDELHVFNPTDYKYYQQLPQRENAKFLIVFFCIWLDNEAYDDTRMWLPKEEMMNVLINDNNGMVLYAPLDYSKQVRFKELENSFNYNDDSIAQAYGQYRYYSNTPENYKTAGEISVNEYYLRGGKSNAQDGYIIFEIPKNTRDESISFRSSFYSFGWSEWKLKIPIEPTKEPAWSIS